jgi:hypothetical protein
MFGVIPDLRARRFRLGYRARPMPRAKADQMVKKQERNGKETVWAKKM